MFPNLLSLFLFSYWCAYGPESTRKISGGEITMNPHGSTKMKRNPRQSIKVGCRCHFIMHRLYMRPNDVILTYTECRHIDQSGGMCHGKNAVGRPQTFKYAPHLSFDIRASVEKMIEDGFNVTMVWDKFISDVEHQSGELFTGVTRDALMTRMDISNIYHNIRKKEYMKDESDPTSVELLV
jgi:hypothetical protein